MAGPPQMPNNFLQFCDSGTETWYPIHLYSRYVDRLHVLSTLPQMKRTCYDSSPIYTYFLTLLTYDTPPESPYSSGPPTGPLEPMDRLMPNPYPN